MSNTVLTESFNRHQFILQRLASHEVGQFDPFIVRADRIIRDVLSGHGEFTTRKALNDIIRRLEKELSATYNDWGALLLDDFKEIAESEGAYASQSLTKATGQKALLPTPSQLWSAALQNPIQMSVKGESALISELFESFTAVESKRVSGAVRLGFAQGSTIQQVITAIRGTKKAGYKDGILSASRNAAETIARTTTNHVSNTARQRTYKSNQDIVEGWVFSATLDSVTSKPCRYNDQLAQDGKVWPIGEGPQPPLHRRCRSSSFPKLKKKYDFDIKSTRAQKGAYGSGQTKEKGYLTWLDSQPKWFQEDVLGKAQTKLFREGGLSPTQFNKLVNSAQGKPLTLAQIKAKDQQAWDMAGLD